MVERHPLLQIHVRKQRSRRCVRSPHAASIALETERKHIRQALSADQKFNSLLVLRL
jgi:hypothetical protein